MQSLWHFTQAMQLLFSKGFAVFFILFFSLSCWADYRFDLSAHVGTLSFDESSSLEKVEALTTRTDASIYFFDVSKLDAPIREWGFLSKHSLVNVSTLSVDETKPETSKNDVFNAAVKVDVWLVDSAFRVMGESLFIREHNYEAMQVLVGFGYYPVDSGLFTVGLGIQSGQDDTDKDKLIDKSKVHLNLAYAQFFDLGATSLKLESAIDLRSIEEKQESRDDYKDTEVLFDASLVGYLNQHIGIGGFITYDVYNYDKERLSAGFDRESLTQASLGALFSYDLNELFGLDLSLASLNHAYKNKGGVAKKEQSQSGMFAEFGVNFRF